MDPAAVNWQGKVIDGRYLIEGVLGKGGMGIVLRARHKFTGAKVALKMLHTHMRLQDGLAERFLAEARAPAVIGHPGIVTVMDAGQTQDGELYLVMELLQGQPLREVMARGRMAPAAARRVAVELLAALGAAHSAGFVHRDLKPENIFITSSGTLKLLDFGIAKVLSDDLSFKGQTLAGSVLGTVWYMAPEQLHDSRAVDLRADLWAVGVIVYEMLTGSLPYRADTVMRMIAAMMTQEPEPLQRILPGAPHELVTFMTRALAREPQQRFQHAAEMVLAIGTWPVGAEGGKPLKQLLPVSAPPSIAFDKTEAGTPAPAAGSSSPAFPPPGTAHSSPAYPPPPGTGYSAPAYPPPPGTGYSAHSSPAYPPGAYPPASQSSPAYPPPLPVPATVAVSPSPRGKNRLWLIIAAAILVGASIGAGYALSGDGTAKRPAAPTSAPETTPTTPVTTPSPAPTPAPATPPTTDPIDDLRRPRPQEPLPPLTIPEDPAPAPAPAPAPVRPPRAGPTPPAPTEPASEPGIAVEPAPTSEPEPAPAPAERSDAQVCADGCKILKKCGLYTDATCEPGCLSSPATLACARKANDCNSASACVLTGVCGGQGPRGRNTCAVAAGCEAGCGADFACACRCVGQMSPRHAFALLILNQCALACGTDLNCVQQRCGKHITRCQSQ